MASQVNQSPIVQSGSFYQWNGQQYNSMQQAVTAKNNYNSATVSTPTPANTSTPSTSVTSPSSGGGNSSSSTTPVPLTQPATPSPSGGTPTGSDTGNTSAFPLTTNPDLTNIMGNAGAAEQELTNPTSTDPSSFEQQLFDKYAKEAAPQISATEQAFNDQIQTEKDLGANQQQGAGAALVAAGLQGSTIGAGTLGEASKLTDDQINTLIDQRGQAVETILANVRQNAETNAPTLAANAVTAVKEISQNYVNLMALKSSFPDEYTSLLNAFGGDENSLIASSAISAPSVVSSYTQGSSFVQVVKDPISGAVHAQTFDLGVTPPIAWTSQKTTNAIIFTDPNNAANSISYTTDPLTGQLTVSATGTGLQTLGTAGIQSGTSPTGANANNPTPTGASNASSTISSILGVDPTTPLATVIESQGLGSVVGAIIKNEGSSPSGVVNNPGNIKFAGLPGQTDSGVKATDGGTFASYKTPLDGQHAIASLVNEAGAGDTTLQDFVNKYTGQATQNTSSTIDPTTGLDSAEYGKLASVKGFDPTKPGLDQDAWNQLATYMSTGAFPTSSRSTVLFESTQAIQARARDLYKQATRQDLPDGTTLKNNLGLISKNNALQNNLNVQTGVIAKNFGLSLENMNDNNINQAPPAINKIADYLAQAAGDTSVAQYLSQNATLQQEIGSLLSVKNASGVTVADKIAAGDLLPTDLSAGQQKQILQTLMKEATNQQKAIGEANATLYQQTDPLGLDPQNPINAPGYKPLTATNFSSNYDGTWTDSNGTTGYTVKGNELVSPDGSQTWDLTQ